MQKSFDKSYKICEYEVNPDWKKFVGPAYKAYRRKWDMASKGHLFKFPLCIEIESSYYCNLKCPMCARQTLGTFAEKGLFDRKLYRKLLNEARRNSMPAIMLDHEAEPLTNPSISEMVKEAQESGIIDIWIHTNANLLTEELSEKLIKNGLTKINFSIDAISEDTYDVLRPGGSLRKVVNNILYFLDLKKKLKKNHIRSRVSFAVQKENKREQEAFFEFWKDKVNLITFQTLIDFRKFKNRVRHSPKDCSGFSCNKTWQMMIIRYNGDIVPCGMPLRYYKKEDYLVGNLYKTSIEECWNSEKLNSIRGLHIRNEYQKIPFCRDCLMAYRRV